MKHSDETNKQQLTELEQLRKRVTELERSNSELTGAVEEFRESQEDLEAIFNNVRDGIILLDLTGKIVKINKRITDATGYTEEDIVGKRFKFLKMFTAKSMIKMIAAFAKTAAGQQSPPYEVEGYIKTGEKRIAEIHGSQLKKRGKTVGAVAVIRDITERKRVEQELRESDERFRKVVETMEVGLATSDENGILTYVNEFSCSMIGYSVDEMVGHDPTDFFYDEEERKAQQEIFEKRRKGMRDASTHEVAWRTKDGRKVYSILTPTPMFDAEGRYQGSFAIHTDITERKQMEEELRKSEEKYREIINGMNDTAWVIDFDGKFIDVNDAAVEVIGYSREELLSMGPHDIDHTLDAEEIRALIKEMPTDKIQVFETTHITKDGKTIPVEIKSSLVTYQGKRAILSIARDITDRKQAEEAVRQSEERFRALYEDNPSMYFTVDAEGTVLSVNQFGAEQLGYTVKELVGQPVLNVFYEDDKKAVYQHFSECLQNPQGLFHWEFRKVRKDGKIIWVKEAARAVQSVDGNLVVLIVCEDITERKKTEEAFRESEERYRSLVESSTDAIMMLDHDENVITCNQAFLDLFGYHKEEIVGKPIRIIHPSDESAQKFRDAHYQTLERKGSVRTEWEYVRKDGTSFPAELVISLISSTEGTIIGCISIIRDITERKRADEKLKANFNTLSKSLESTVSALASAFEVRDPYTAGHQQRVTDLACTIAEDMGLGLEQIAGIRMAGLIHDIGKINIPAEILNKPGHLSEIEYSLFKNHPQVGYDVLQNVEFPWPVAQIVLQHHERIDGSGYPQGLKGEEILLEARILAVADIVEAIASHRPYRPARGIGDALEEILHNKGTLYDPEVVDACLRVFYEKGFTFEELAKVETPLPKIH